MTTTNEDIFSKFNHYYSRLCQEMAYKTGGSFGKPTDPIILLTNHCNARCLHCHSWKASQKENMTTEDWKKAIEDLRKWLGPVFISITGGETLLKKDAIEIVEYTAKLGFRVELLTNGFLMTPEKAKRLIQSGVKRITISLDGSKPEIHDKIRGKVGFFDNAVKALQMLVDERARSGHGVEIWAKTVIMSHNVKDLSNIVMLVKKLGITGVLYQSLTPVYYSEQQGDPNWYENNPLWIVDKKTLSQSVQHLRTLKSKGYPILNTIENLNLIESYYIHPEELAHKVQTHDYHDYKKARKECRSWLGELQIVPDGGIKMCHSMQPFANVKDGHIRKAWRNRTRCWKEPCPYI